jgi:hypothetical protein
MKIFNKVLNHPDLISNPPVLVDLGASGYLPPEWRVIAKYSICIAFDADDREFSAAKLESSHYKTLHLLNRLVSANSCDKHNFYLTKSPYCSSSLEPNIPALDRWAFRELFEVKKIITLESIELSAALDMVNVKQIDWYKTDTQGTDLRIFNSLSPKIISKILVAEFEPGILDAYIGEDKLHHVLSYMDTQPFWVTSMNIVGTQRIQQEDAFLLSNFKKSKLHFFMKNAPAYCEIAYLNELQGGDFTKRDLLLAWVFSTIKQEHGFALSISIKGRNLFSDPIFDEIYNYSKKSFNFNFAKILNAIFQKLIKLFNGVLHVIF